MFSTPSTRPPLSPISANDPWCPDFQWAGPVETFTAALRGRVEMQALSRAGQEHGGHSPDKVMGTGSLGHPPPKAIDDAVPDLCDDLKDSLPLLSSLSWYYKMGNL